MTLITSRASCDANKGGVGIIGALKILPLPLKGEGGANPCQDLFGGFDMCTEVNLK